MSEFAGTDSTFVPELGLRRSLLEGLTLKTLYYLGEASLHEIARHMCVPRLVVESTFQRLRKEQLCQATGMAISVHQITLTQAGRTRATELLALDQYVGPAPVTLEDYLETVRKQSVREIDVSPPDVEQAFSKLVVDSQTLAQLGTAVVSGRAIFLYGPPGTGKTTVAETLATLFQRDAVKIPYAVEVDGQIITVYDSHVHDRLDEGEGSADDPRWVRCRRPSVVVGGELTIDMLDLQFNPISHYYTAPVQMRANNGFLIVDDFGRQRIPPAELLNRWVVPLDRRVDYLTLAGGKKLQIPFDLFVVFATNLDPGKVVEEAFLRRIQTKIRLDSVSRTQFHDIFRRCCEGEKLEYDLDLVDDLVDRITEDFQQPLRACYPRDIIAQVIWRARYENHDPELTAEALAHACRAYFLTREVDADPAAPRIEPTLGNGGSVAQASTATR